MKYAAFPPARNIVTVFPLSVNRFTVKWSATGTLTIGAKNGHARVADVENSPQSVRSWLRTRKDLTFQSKRNRSAFVGGGLRFK